MLPSSLMLTWMSGEMKTGLRAASALHRDGRSSVNLISEEGNLKSGRNLYAGLASIHNTGWIGVERSS